MTSRAESAFFPSLARLASVTPRCRGAAFIDREGEAVEVAGTESEEFQTLVAAAHWRIVLDEATALGFGTVSRLLVSGTRRSYFVQALSEGYALVLVCDMNGAFGASERAVSECAHALAVEAGFTAARAPWHRVAIRPQGPRYMRPEHARYAGAWLQLQVLGSIVGLHSRERGYRVRLENGVEATLVREPLGLWWADEPFDVP